MRFGKASSPESGRVMQVTLASGAWIRPPFPLRPPSGRHTSCSFGRAGHLGLRSHTDIRARRVQSADFWRLRARISTQRGTRHHEQAPATWGPIRHPALREAPLDGDAPQPRVRSGIARRRDWLCARSVPWSAFLSAGKGGYGPKSYCGLPIFVSVWTLNLR